MKTSQIPAKYQDSQYISGLPNGDQVMEYSEKAGFFIRSFVHQRREGRVWQTISATDLRCIFPLKSGSANLEEQCRVYDCCIYARHYKKAYFVMMLDAKSSKFLNTKGQKHQRHNKTANRLRSIRPNHPSRTSTSNVRCCWTRKAKRRKVITKPRNRNKASCASNVWPSSTPQILRLPFLSEVGSSL